jgi:integral membrane protein
VSLVDSAYTRYNVVAWPTAIGLVILFFVGVPLEYGFGIKLVDALVGPVHGFLYIAYLAVTFDLARRRDWPYTRMILVMLAGTIPALTFVAKHYVLKWERERAAARPQPDPANA